jgi:hypothetical protein
MAPTPGTPRASGTESARTTEIETPKAPVDESKADPLDAAMGGFASALDRRDADALLTYTADSPLFVSWRKEGKRWLVDVIAVPGS